jgi:hypothetical protein
MRRTLFTLTIVGMLAIPTMAFAGTGDSSRGQGLWSPSGNTGGQAGQRTGFQASWEALGAGLGDEATGQFDLRSQQDGSGFHALVVCLAFGDNGEAIIGLESTQGQAYEGEAYALDRQKGNGGGRPGSGDKFVLDEYPGSGDGDADCEDDNDATDSIYGDIFNVNA